MATWRSQNLAFLADCGVPDAVANSERSWTYVLLHGNDSPHTGWDPSWISPETAARLLESLRNSDIDRAGHDLFKALERRTAERSTPD